MTRRNHVHSSIRLARHWEAKTCLLIAVFLVGCAFPTDLFFSPPPLPGAYPGPVIPTVTPYYGPTDTPVVLTPTPVVCSYAWTSKNLPDETAFLLEALKKAELGDVEASASAYGENCVDTTNNRIVSFSAMQTDFYFNLVVKDATDKVEMGNWTDRILAVTDQFPPGKVPGANLGYAGLIFQDGKNTQHLWFQLAAAKDARQAGLRGADLFDRLAGP